jgi:hypothetical protein
MTKLKIEPDTFIFFAPLTETGKANHAWDKGRMPVLDNPDEAHFKQQKLEIVSGVEGLAREDDSVSLENGGNGVKVVEALPLEVESLQTEQRKAVLENPNELRCKR